jgi:hypothetical protein
MTITDTTTPATTPEATEVDPWAFLDTTDAVQPTTFIKAPPVEADIPAPIRAMCEKALIASTPMRVKFPDEKMAKDARKFMLGYALVRTATAVIPALAKTAKVAAREEVTVKGPVTIRATIQNDKLTLHFTVKAPFTPTPKATIPTPAAPATAPTEAPAAPAAPAPAAPKGGKK